MRSTYSGQLFASVALLMMGLGVSTGLAQGYVGVEKVVGIDYTDVEAAFAPAARDATTNELMWETLIIEGTNNRVESPLHFTSVDDGRRIIAYDRYRTALRAHPPTMGLAGLQPDEPLIIVEADNVELDVRIEDKRGCYDPAQHPAKVPLENQRCSGEVTILVTGDNFTFGNRNVLTGWTTHALVLLGSGADNARLEAEFYQYGAGAAVAIEQDSPDVTSSLIQSYLTTNQPSLGHMLEYCIFLMHKEEFDEAEDAWKAAPGDAGAIEARGDVNCTISKCGFTGKDPYQASGQSYVAWLVVEELHVLQDDFEPRGIVLKNSMADRKTAAQPTHILFAPATPIFDLELRGNRGWCHDEVVYSDLSATELYYGENAHQHGIGSAPADPGIAHIQVQALDFASEIDDVATYWTVGGGGRMRASDDVVRAAVVSFSTIYGRDDTECATHGAVSSSIYMTNVVPYP